MERGLWGAKAQGSTQQSKMGMPIVMIALGFMFALIGLIASLANGGNVSTAKTLMRDGIGATATVTSLQSTEAIIGRRGRVTQGSREFVGLSYTDATGNPLTDGASDYVGKEDIQGLAVGDPVKIRYRSGYPRTPYIESSLARLASAGWVSWLLALLSAAGVVMLVYGIARLRRVRAMPN